jgi:hypothetical protein
MAIVMVMHWPEVGKEQYEEARKRVNWEGKQPEGARNHVSWFDNGLHVVDVWESEADLNRFIEQRLMPVVKGEMKTPGDPRVQVFPAHAHFVPESVKKEKSAATA